MQQTIAPTSEVVERAGRNVEVLSERLNHLLTFVPDDKLSWKPSSTAKSCLRVAAHSALVSRFFANIISGKMPEPMLTPEEFFGGLYQAEEKITTRESIAATVKETAAELCNAIRTVNAGNIDSAPMSPFGPMPMRFWLDECGEHLAKHVGQVEYLQTIWGDLDNHFG